MAVEAKNVSALRYVLVTAVLMSLGWGLRGYIGGGPLGAMIPGALVALLLCLYLGYGLKATAVAAAFAAVGVGFGGEMTYGQTIGLACESTTRVWGLTGLTVKGGVWGLLGGAVLGLGLAWDRMDRRGLWPALACLLIAAAIGTAGINEPKLIYFSDPVNEPRAESWAGLLFGALGLLGYLSLRHKAVASIAWRFALYGLVGGAIGFGGGGLFMAFGHGSGAPKWVPWWKFMEFTFGFLLGASYGLCAYRLRDVLRPSPRETVDGDDETYWDGDFFKALGLVFASLVVWTLIGGAVEMIVEDSPSFWLLSPLGRVFFGYVGLGCIFMLLAAYSEKMAWHIAATVTFLASIVDFFGDLPAHSDLQLSPAVRWTFMAVFTLLAVAAVVSWQRRRGRTISGHILGLLWALTIVGMVKPFIDIWELSPKAYAKATADGLVPFIVDRFEGMFIVHGLFLAMALISTWDILAEARRGRASRPSLKTLQPSQPEP